MSNLTMEGGDIDMKCPMFQSCARPALAKEPTPLCHEPKCYGCEDLRSAAVACGDLDLLDKIEEYENSTDES